MVNSKLVGKFRRTVRRFAPIFAFAFLLIALIAKSPMTARGTICPVQASLVIVEAGSANPMQCVCKEKAAKQVQSEIPSQVQFVTPNELVLRQDIPVETRSDFSQLKVSYLSSESRAPLVPPPNDGFFCTPEPSQT